MRFKIHQDTLSKGLTTVSRYTANKGQLPILANILIEADRSGVFLSATNLEMGIRVDIGEWSKFREVLQFQPKTWQNL